MFKVMEGGRGASAMFKVLAEATGRQPCSRCWQRLRGVSHIQSDGRGVRGVSHVQGDGRG